MAASGSNFSEGKKEESDSNFELLKKLIYNYAHNGEVAEANHVLLLAETPAMRLALLQEMIIAYAEARNLYQLNLVLEKAPTLKERLELLKTSISVFANNQNESLVNYILSKAETFKERFILMQEAATYYMVSEREDLSNAMYQKIYSRDDDYDTPDDLADYEDPFDLQRMLGIFEKSSSNIPNYVRILLQKSEPTKQFATLREIISDFIDANVFENAAIVLNKIVTADTRRMLLEDLAYRYARGGYVFQANSIVSLATDIDERSMLSKLVNRGLQETEIMGLREEAIEPPVLVHVVSEPLIRSPKHPVTLHRDEAKSPAINRETLPIPSPLPAARDLSLRLDQIAGISGEKIRHITLDRIKHALEQIKPAAITKENLILFLECYCINDSWSGKFLSKDKHETAQKILQMLKGNPPEQFGQNNENVLKTNNLVSAIVNKFIDIPECAVLKELIKSAEFESPKNKKAPHSLNPKR